jgi:hypothetical protein
LEHGFIRDYEELAVTYAELVTAIGNYVESNELSFVQNIPRFIRSVEQKVFNATQLPVVRSNVTGSLTAGNQYLTAPLDFLSVFSLALNVPGAHKYLVNKDVNFIREAFPSLSATGAPQYYAQFDENTLLLGPTPDQSYPMQLHYFRYPGSIVDNGTSWLGDNFDTVLLYGALVEANMYLKGEAELQQTYERRFQEALGLLKQLSDGKLRQDTYRSGQIRVPVQ